MSSWTEGFVVALLTVFFGPCLATPTESTYAPEGTMSGINGYEGRVEARIKFTPHRAAEIGEFPYWTAAITFTKGGQYVEGIEMYDYRESFDCICHLNCWGDHFEETSSGVWESLLGTTSLYNMRGFLRFYAYAADGTRICVGTMEIMYEGLSAPWCNVPDWEHDGIGTETVDPDWLAAS